MKRLIAISLILIIIQTTALTGCSGSTPENGNANVISIVCTIFPQYDWVRQILGDEADNINLTLLLTSRIDLHSYQPSVDDLLKISVCDLFVYVGGESDKWVDDALKDVTNKNMIVINLLDTIGDAAKAEELIEGMEEELEDTSDDHGDDTEYDEHVWLSLKNAQTLCVSIADALSSLDSGNAEVYQNNLAAYVEKLSALDSEYRAVIDSAAVKTLLFGDRFPFRYLVDDYGLNYYAAFAGCSAETEASFETIIFLSGKVDELSLKHVMVTESSDKKIAETIIRESKGNGQKILTMDAIQSISPDDMANGATYLSIMESNLNILSEALGTR